MVNLAEKVNLGRYYSEEWKLLGILSSAGVSLFLRSMPILFGIDSWGWLYYLPIWIPLEIHFIYLFAIYGWTGVLVSVTIDSIIRPGLVLELPFFVFSQMFWVTLVVMAIIVMDLPSRIHDLWDMLIVFMVPALIAVVLESVIILAFDLGTQGVVWSQQWVLEKPGLIFLTFFISSLLATTPPDAFHEFIAPLKTPYSSRPIKPRSSKPSTARGSKRKASLAKPKHKSAPAAPSRQSPPPFSKQKQAISTKVRKAKHISTGKITLRKVPGPGDIVIARNKGKIRLGSILGKGGEGVIYETQTKLVCKIYSRKRLTISKQEKLETMLNKTINIPGVCWPLDIVKYSGTFCGYIMRKASGWELRKVVQHKQELLNKFPSWTRKNLVSLLISILDRIHRLHQENIIIGDLNGLNILLEDESKVYFVDTDSYQVDGYPCPVGTSHFTPPELQGKNYRRILRDPVHEYFSLAVLVFMTLLPGKHPFAQQGGTSPIENIRRGKFSYRLGEWSNYRTPRGPWRYIWSHFPRYLKRKFHRVFTKNERFSPFHWREVMERYQYDLRKGHVSDEIFPADFKQIKETIVVCSSCGQTKTTAKTYLETLKTRNEEFLCERCQQKKP